MEYSKLENIGNTQLFYLLKSFVSISDETNPDMDDYNLSNNCILCSKVSPTKYSPSNVRISNITNL